MTQGKNHEHAKERSKKELILDAAKEFATERITAAEIEQIRRRLIAQTGSEGNTSADYIASVLTDAGRRVMLSTHADTEGRYEEEFHDLLHFSTLEEAEMCLIRLDELYRKFRRERDRAAEERAREVGALGRRRAEMIARNHKVDPAKRAEKEEIAQWFAVWLQTPDVFFDWLEVRKQTPDYEKRFGASSAAEA